MKRRVCAILFAALTLLVFALATSRDAHAELPDHDLRVRAIKIEGLVRTHEYVVRRELGFTEGDTITRAQLDLAVTRLWNTTIFAHVDVDVVQEGDEDVIVFRLEDRWTLNPLLSGGYGGNAKYIRVGLSDNNLLGHFLELQGQYENFEGFHGGQIIFHHPRVFDRRLDLLVQAERLVRTRPGFSDQRSQAIVELATLADSDRLRIGMRVSFFADRFLPPVDPPPFYPKETETFLFGPTFRIGRIDIIRIRQTGASFELRPGVGFTNSDVVHQYATMTGEILAFKMVGERWNFAARFRASNVSETPPHLELYAGGLDLVRGFPDNFVRTRAFALSNLEARFVAFDSTWIALVPTVFVDAIAARSPNGTPGTAVSAGGGVRILIPKFVGTGLRADLAVPLSETFRSVSEAEQARFGPVTPTVDIGTLQPSFGVYQFF
jgi:hypothetical protein